MGDANKTRNNTGDRTPELSPEQETIASAPSDPVTAFQAIDLEGVANFAALKGELLLAEHEIFDGEAPDTFAKVRNRVIALLTRQGKAGIETALGLIELKAGLKEKNHWVRYGTPIAQAMGLSGVSALNHIIKRTEGPAKLPKRILSAMIELGLEPIDGRNKRLIDNLPRHFEGTSGQARELVRAEQDRVTQARREARAKRAAKKGRKGNGAASDHPAQSLSERLRNCPDSERLAMIEAEVAAFNGEMATYLSAYKLQLVPVTDAARPTDESHRASLGQTQHVRPVANESSTDVVQNEDFPLYFGIADDRQNAPLKPGDRSGLARRIIETHGRDIEAVLGDSPADEQAQTLDYVYKRVTQSCSPAVRRGSVIATSAEHIAPPLQARRGELLERAN